jgi:hypothetical protein
MALVISCEMSSISLLRVCICHLPAGCPEYGQPAGHGQG